MLKAPFAEIFELFILAAFYEGGTFIYTLLRPPKKNTFDVIKKVRI